MAKTQHDKIDDEHIFKVPAAEIHLGDYILFGREFGQVDRVEIKPNGFVFPIYIVGNSGLKQRRGWCFPSFHKDGLVTIYAPLFCGGRSLELRKMAVAPPA